MYGRPQPKRIIQIVSGSRSGSTLLKHLLSQSPSVCSLDGEEEPYFRMTGNGYGLNSQSDQINEVKNKEVIRELIYEELTTESPWKHRLQMQYKGEQLYKLLEGVRAAESLDRTMTWSWLEAYGILGNYDGCPKNLRKPFNGEFVYEMRPYIIPRTVRERGEPKDILVLKCPYNVYRWNVIQSIFPESEITNIILFRNPAAILNGLYDGWCANYGFHKYLTPYGWWKFDLPPRWESVATKNIWEKSFLQFSSSYEHIKAGQKKGDIICSFEELVAIPALTRDKLCRILDLEPPICGISDMGNKMSTESPDPLRWKKRADKILPLLENTNAKEKDIIKWMGYNMEEMKCR